MLRELLRERADAVAERWYEAALAVYHPEAVRAFTAQADPFANPVGHGLRAGTRTLLRGILDNSEADALRPALEEIVAVRAVQQFPPSQALSFVLALRGILRREVEGMPGEVPQADQWADIDARIDELALLAFDAYTARRERVAELRINEIKRSVPWTTVRERKDPAREAAG